MVHPNAALTPRHRLQVARLVVDDGYPLSEVAARFQCSWPTVKRWADRYRAGEPIITAGLQPEQNAPGGGQTSGVAAVAQAPWAGATRRTVRHCTVDRPPGAR